MFHKTRVGYNPFLGMRDWGIFLAIYLSAPVVAYLIISALHLNAAAIPSILIGAFVGSLPAMVMCLPVHGWIAKDDFIKFKTQIINQGFRLSADSEAQKIFTYKSARWTRWDSNRVVIASDAASDTIPVVIPLYVYKRM